jgi:hypothetical protein
VVLRRADGSLVEGVVDLASREESENFAGWTVVDFKTDREFESASAAYLAQVGLLPRGGRLSDPVARTGRPARCLSSRHRSAKP